MGDNNYETYRITQDVDEVPLMPKIKNIVVKLEDGEEIHLDTALVVATDKDSGGVEFFSCNLKDEQLDEIFYAVSSFVD